MENLCAQKIVQAVQPMATASPFAQKIVQAVQPMATASPFAQKIVHEKSHRQQPFDGLEKPSRRDLRRFCQ